MEEQILPKSVCDIIDECIFSVSQLETLLLLRLYSNRKWTAKQLSDELQTHHSAAHDMLSKLAQCGLIKRYSSTDSDSFQYDAIEDEVDTVIGQLAHSYQLRRMRVIDRIYQKPGRADSFRLMAARLQRKGQNEVST
jgi:predicted transcriptional regulator